MGLQGLGCEDESMGQRVGPNRGPMLPCTTTRSLPRSHQALTRDARHVLPDKQHVGDREARLAGHDGRLHDRPGLQRRLGKGR